MSVSLHEHRLGGLRWIVLNGPDREAFGALGEHVRGEPAALAGVWPVLSRLRRHVSGSPGRDFLAAVRQATEEAFPLEWAELAAFAAGAGVPADDLVLLNLRGDLGLVDGGIGCSDLGWRRETSVPSWFLDVLTRPPPGGVRSDPGPDGRGLTTLCTLVADLTAGEAVIAARGEPPVAIPLVDLAAGNPRAQRPFSPARF